MPAALASTDRLLVRLCAVAGNQIGLNLLHYSVDSLLGTVDLVAVASQLDSDISAAYKACLSSDAQYRGLDVRVLLPVASPAWVDATSAGPGLGPATLAGRQLSGLIQKRTIVAGRAGRGRMYVPFPSAGSAEADGTPNSSYMTDLTGLAQVVDDTISVTDAINGGSADLIPLVWHDATGTGTVIDFCQPVDAWATQMRRGSYGRPNVPPF